MKKTGKSSQKVYKTLWEEEKLLVTSNFSFSHSVFQKLVLQTLKNKCLFWQGLRRQKLMDRMVFYTTFNIISIISLKQLTNSCIPWVFTSTRLRLCFAQGHPHEKNQSAEGLGIKRTSD